MELRVAIRSLLRRPGFTAAAVLTLGLAAGANAAIFAIVHGVLLKPLPYREPERLAAVWPGRFQSNADLEWLREHGSMFASLATVAPGWTMALTGAGEPAKVTVARVSGNLFETLGVQPLLGRTFREDDARKGGDAVVILTHGFWRRQFGGDPAVIGRTVQLEGGPFEIVGVTRPEFEVFGLKTDAFTPFALDSAAWYHQLTFSLFVARLAPRRSLEQADRDYRALIPEIRRARQYSDDYGQTARLQDLRSAVVGDVSATLVALGAAVGLILLIAGANVGTLLLARAAGRSRELAVRAAIGASRWRIARGLLAEGAIVALAGGAVGVVAARLALPAIVAGLPRDTPRTGDIAVDWLVAAAVVGAATVVGLGFALAPAFTASRFRSAELLRTGGGSESRQSKRLRGVLVSAEIALALVLSVGAGLMLQSLWRLQQVDPGFNAGQVLTLHLQPAGVGHQQARPTAEYYRLLFERLSSIPGVTAVGAIQHLPFSGYSWTAALDVEGHTVPAGASRPTAGLRIATPGYFRALGQRVVAGREFLDQDARHGETALVNEAFAKRFYGSAPATLGRKVRIRGGGIQSDWMTIAGVVGTVRHDSLTNDPAPEIYTSVSASSIPAMMLAIRTGGEPLALVPAVREAIRGVDPDVPISDVQTMTAKVGGSLARPRLLVMLLGSFAAVGVLLALVGVYGVVAYSVTQRTREIGIMVALGADRTRVLRLVLRDGLLYAAGGLAAGIPGALLASGLLRSMLFGIDAMDPGTYAVLAAAMTAVVLAASGIPARRAAHVDPLHALKHD